VLEVTAGTGCNLPMYPPGIRLTGIDFSPAMLELARRQADRLGLDAELRVGDAQALDLPDDGFDTVVRTLSLCASPTNGARSPRRGGAAAGRLQPLDHVAAAPRWAAT
jgi:ubiquinone/menaquinone biosynthesis C-methylase UbiE